MVTVDRNAARRRAIRAAQLVTLSVSLATGCGAATGLNIGDGGSYDAGHDADADGGTDARCTHAPPIGCVTGPFVPPATV